MAFPVDCADTEFDEEEVEEAAPPTELDTDSSSSVEIVAVTPAPPPDLTASAAVELAWGGQLRLAAERARLCCGDVAQQVGWQLQEQGEVDALGHVVQCVDGCMRRWGEFKIGITMNPRRRWELYGQSPAPRPFPFLLSVALLLVFDFEFDNPSTTR